MWTRLCLIVYAQLNFLLISMVSIIIPTLNEAGSIVKILSDLEKQVGGRFAVEIIVVDDASTDNTVALVTEITPKLSTPIKMIVRKERGLATAVLFGMKFARGDAYLVMDADGSHPASVIPQMLDALQRGADLVVGTRHGDGGGVEEWPLHRKFFSQAATFFARPLSQGVSDPLSGLFAIKKTCLDGVELSPIGYKILLEILVKAKCNTCREIPYVFMNREVGHSKLNRKIAVQYFIHLWRLYRFAREKRVRHKITTKQVMSWVGALLFTAALCIPVVEWGFATFVKPRYYIFPEDMYAATTPRCYEFTKNFSGTITTDEYTTTFTTNAQGLRYGELEVKKPRGVTRILAVGDSFVPQFTVEAHETFLARLERDLSATGATQVIPLGVNGYNTAQERMYVEEEGMKYDPDAIALFFYENDFFDTHRFLTQPPTDCVREGILYSGNSESKGWLAQNLPGVNFVKLKMHGWVTRTSQQTEPINHFTQNFNPENEENITSVVQEIEKIKVIAEKNSIPFSVIVVPHKRTIYEPSTETHDFQAITKRLVKELNARNIAIVNTTESVRAAAAVDNRRLYFVQDDHFTPYGNEVFSYIIREEIQKMIK